MEIPAEAGLGHGMFVSLTRLGTVSPFFPLVLFSVLIMFGLENWQGSKGKCTLQISYGASQSLGMCLSVVSPGAGSVKYSCSQLGGVWPAD